MTNSLQLQNILFYSTDGVSLFGQLRGGGKEKCVIHVHGLGGNAYSSVYHDSLAESYAELGYDYVTFNNRGAFYIEKLKKIDGTSDYFGATYELFEESKYDLEGAITYAMELGYTKVILQGHSSGAQKIVYAVSRLEYDGILEKIILLSPCDDIGLAKAHYGEEQIAAKCVAAAKVPSRELMHQDFFFNMPMSAQTFLSHYGEESFFNIFHYHDAEKEFSELKELSVPTLVLFGEHDYVSDFDVVKKVYGEIPTCTLQIIPHADHKYKQNISGLINTIINFVDAH